jgi:C1A family cysteine protease
MGGYFSYVATSDNAVATTTTTTSATAVDTVSSNRIYGFKRDTFDSRDFFHPPSTVDDHPNSVDLRSGFTAPYDQGKLGSCTANAIAGALEYDETKQGLELGRPSRLFIYYNERDIEGTINEDSGAMLRDGIKCINRLGYCSEESWRYDISRFREKPPSSCYTEARQHHSLEYKRVPQTLRDIKTILAGGYPIVFGIAVYESFESPTTTRTGVVPMPLPHERMLGGHAIAMVGYDEEKKHVICRNSWGEVWGDNGYFYLPYEYVTNASLASDFWTVTRVC